MRKLFSFYDFIFESSKNNLPFRLSKRLVKLLSTIDHPIAYNILDMNYDKVETDITLIDYDEDNISNFTCTMSNKFYDYIAAENPEENKYTIFDTIFSRYYNSPQAWTKFRAPIKIGRFVNRIFPDIYKQNGVAGKDIESFVNVVKLKRTQQFERFKIVKGDDILKYYSESNYDERATDGTGLGNSCMRYSKCQQYLKFYPNNNVEMLILMSEDEDQKDKIVGRALLWDIKYINEVEVNRKFMDRIYVVNDFDIQNFKDYATKNKWLHKKCQNRNPGEAIYDSIDNTLNYLSLKTDNTFKKSKYYPYLDTVGYFYTDDGFLSNKSN